MNSKDSKICDPHKLLLRLTDKIYLKRKHKYIASSNCSIYYTWKNVKKLYKNIKLNTSASKWHEQFKLPDRSYSISEIQDYCEYIFKKHGKRQSILK